MLSLSYLGFLGNLRMENIPVTIYKLPPENQICGSPGGSSRFSYSLVALLSKAVDINNKNHTVTPAYYPASRYLPLSHR